MLPFQPNRPGRPSASTETRPVMPEAPSRTLATMAAAGIRSMAPRPHIGGVLRALMVNVSTTPAGRVSTGRAASKRVVRLRRSARHAA